jgi:peptide chain release factor 1
MLDKLFEVERRFEVLENKLADPGIFSRGDEYKKTTKERADLEPIIVAYRELKRIEADIAGNTELLADADPEMRAMAEAEIGPLRAQEAELRERVKLLLLPKDPNDAKNVILEIRAGTGGDEAALFAADLFRMYGRFAEKAGWRVEILSQSDSGDGLKEVIALIEGREVFSNLKYEAGVHRVQRVPATEAQGRIHTSTATVAVLPEADDVEVQIEEKDLRIDVFRSGGPGGQSVNTTDSAVRITHIPSGLVVSCQDEKSQHKNKAKAKKVLAARLLEKQQAEQSAKEAAERKGQVGSGERSEKIRTYNFPQSRLTDHRIGLSTYDLPKRMDGDLETFITALRTHYQTEQLKGGDGGA